MPTRLERVGVMVSVLLVFSVVVLASDVMRTHGLNGRGLLALLAAISAIFLINGIYFTRVSPAKTRYLIIGGAGAMGIFLLWTGIAPLIALVVGCFGYIRGLRIERGLW